MWWILGILLSGSLLLAGSDGAWFPWANMAGGALLVVVSIIIIRKERREREKSGTKYSARRLY